MEYLGDVLNRRHNVADVDALCFHLQTADVDDRQNGSVHDDRKNRPDAGHQDLHGEVGLLIVGICHTEAFDFVGFTGVCLDNARTGDAFLYHGVHAVELFLHDGELRECLQNHEQDNGKLEGERDRNNVPEGNVEGQAHRQTADHEDGRTDEHTEDHLYEILQGGDVVCQTGDKRTGREFVGLFQREGHDLVECVDTDVAAEALGRDAGGIAAHQTHEAADGNESEHLQTGRKNGAHDNGDFAAFDNGVDDLGHEFGLHKVDNDFAGHE